MRVSVMQSGIQISAPGGEYDQSDFLVVPLVPFFFVGEEGRSPREDPDPSLVRLYGEVVSARVLVRVPLRVAGAWP